MCECVVVVIVSEGGQRVSVLLLLLSLRVGNVLQCCCSCL